MPTTKNVNRYTQLIEAIFLKHYRDGMTAVDFDRNEITELASETCYSLQNHLRTTVSEMGQVETDEIYIGIDKRGAQYVLPIQAKGRTDRIGIVQIEQDIAVCTAKFPDLICRPLAAQFMQNGVIAMFEFEQVEDEIRVTGERHYRLVGPDALSTDELAQYRNRLI